MGTPPSMTPERWRQVTAIFHEAVDRDAVAREAFLDRACAGDRELRVEVDAMLAAHRDAGQFGEVPLVLTPTTGVVESKPQTHPFVWLVWLAVPALAAMFLYALWVLVPNSRIAGPLGWDEQRQGTEWFVSRVDPPGIAAGLLSPGDRILTLNGTPPMNPFGTALHRRRLTAGQTYQLAIDRSGERRDLHVMLPARGSDVPRTLAYFLMSLAWCAVGVFIGLAKPELPVARLAAIAAIMTGVDYLQIVVVRSGTVFQPMHLVVGCHFFFRFPTGLDLRRFARLILTFMYVVGGLLALMGTWMHTTMLVQGAGGMATAVSAHERLFGLRGVMINDLFYLSLVVIVSTVVVNYRRLTDTDARRRVQWVVYGSIVSLIPQIVMSGVEILRGVPQARWLAAFADSCTAGMPLAFAYAILKYRVFDIRVVVRRGLQYLFARQALQVLLAIPIVVLVAVIVRNRNLTVVELASRNTGYLFWIAAALVGLRFRASVNAWLDRRFFREQYDREQLLLRTFDSLTRLDSHEEMSGLVREQLEFALHPTSIHFWYRDDDDSGTAPPEPLVRRLEESGTLIQLATIRLSREEARWAARLDAHLLVPITDGSGRVMGAIVLGARKSEQHYSAGDCSLLQAIGKQIGVAGETLRLRAQVGEDRRIRHDVLAKLDSRRINVLKQCPVCGRCFDAADDQCDQDGQALTLSLPVERTIAARYRLDRLIGKGGMGAVYAARDLRLDRVVALKILLGRAFGHQPSVRRFEREARAAARLNHRNIVSVYDVGHLEGEGAYLVMERLHGVTLREALARAGRLSTIEIAAWFEQLLDGLSEAHAHGVVHRDLKPDNVIGLKSEPDGLVVKILDFGLAKLRADEAAASRSITIEGGVMGTIGYISPEQLAGRDVDHRTDIFAIGVMLVEALTGERPFVGETYAELARALEMSYHLPGGGSGWSGVDAVVQRCLAKDPAARYASTTVLREALIPALRVAPIA